MLISNFEDILQHLPVLMWVSPFGTLLCGAVCVCVCVCLFKYVLCKNP